MSAARGRDESVSGRLGAAARRLKAGIGSFFSPGHADAEVRLDAVLRDELRLISARRRRLNLRRPAPEFEHYTEDLAWSTGLIGLCFSGGGIRSAAFNLGVLQRLAGYGLLRHVDYLSTVSGGGYIGSWLTALLHRELAAPDDPYPEDDAGFEQEFRRRFRDFEDRLAWSAGDSSRAGNVAAREHPAVAFLRRYSNYLAPKLGVFSADTWSLFSTYLRNVVLNQLVLVLALGGVLLVPRFASGALDVVLFRIYPDTPFRLVSCAVAGALIIVWCAWRLGTNLAATDGLADRSRRPPEPLDTYGIITRIVAPVGLLGVLAGVVASDLPTPGRGQDWLIAAGSGAVLNLFVWLVASGAAASSGWRHDRGVRPWRVLAATAAIPGLLIGLLLLAAGRWLDGIEYIGFRIALGPPLLIGAVLAGAILHVGIAGNGLDTHRREWLSRFGGVMAIVAIVWSAITALVFLGPWVVQALPEKLNWSLIAGWAGSTAGGVYLGRTQSGRTLGFVKGVVTAAAPWIFILGLLLILAQGVHELLAVLAASVPGGGQIPAAAGAESFANYRAALAATDGALLVLVLFAVAAGLTYLLSARIDINSFSLHNMYANRLVRCFLGAANESANDERRVNPFTEFSATDDLGLAACNAAGGRLVGLSHTRRRADTIDTARSPAYPGPYQIVNTAINLASSRNLAWQERKAGSFVLSPLYCGYTLSGTRPDGSGAGDRHAYRPTGRFASDPKPLTLGEAVATSGAAASPNMGYHTTAALAFLMGVFNIRLGQWAPNPMPVSGGGPRLWQSSGPSFALEFLLREVFGMTDENNKFVYLSDGGHFENLGLYEAVRRRCRYVIASDSGADPDYRFEDLGNAIRKCRVDLRTEIDIDVRQVGRVDEGRFNGAPCAIGKIRYPDGQVGVLIYIKSCRWPGAPTDVIQYARANKSFPHETTADQFFSESQFESYRRLGYFLATQIFATAMDDVRSAARSARDKVGPGGDAADDCRDEISIERLFRRLEQNWYPSSPAVSSNFSRLAAQVDSLFRILRTSDELQFLSEQFYPEWRTLMDGPPDAPAPHDARIWEIPTGAADLSRGFYFCNSLIQLMENVYLDLGLETEWDHPDNSGWMNVFRHWTWSAMFRVTWAISAATYGRRFREFCRQRLDLVLGEVAVTPVLDGPPPAGPGFEALLEQHSLNLVERNQILALVGQHLAGRAIRIYRLDLEVPRTLADPSATPAERLLRTFAFGYAVVAGAELWMYRVQDHLRNMELGRRGLEALVDTDAAGPDLEMAGGAEALLRDIGEQPDRRAVSEFRATLLTVRAERAASRRP